MTWPTQPFEKTARADRKAFRGATTPAGGLALIPPATDVAPAGGATVALTQELNQPLSLAMRYVRVAARLNERGLASRARLAGALLAAGVQLVRMGSILRRLRGPPRQPGLPGGVKVQAPDGLFAALTPREREVLRAMVAGKLNKVTAGELGISTRTVEVYRANVMAKTGAASLSELVARYTLEEANRSAWRDHGGGEAGRTRP